MRKDSKELVAKNTLFCVIDAGFFASKDIGNGIMLPALYLKYQPNQQFEALFNIHEHCLLGDVKTSWGKDKNSKDFLYLKLVFEKPMIFTMNIEFNFQKHYMIIDAIQKNEGLWLLQENKKLSESPNQKKILVPVATLDILDWEKTIKIMLSKYAKKQGFTGNINSFVNNMLYKMRELRDFRMK